LFLSNPTTPQVGPAGAVEVVTVVVVVTPGPVTVAVVAAVTGTVTTVVTDWVMVVAWVTVVDEAINVLQ
jgi:hypothetical protein